MEAAAAIIGILAAAGKVAEILHPVVSSLRDYCKNAATILSELNNLRVILNALRKYLDDLNTAPRERKELIQVDQLVAALTDGVLLFSELEVLVIRLDNPDFALPKRMQWAWKDKEFASLVARIQCFKSSISVMLSILQCESDLEAKRNQQELLTITSDLLKNNIQLSRRLAHLEYYMDGGSSILTRRPASLAPTEITVVREPTNRLSLETTVRRSSPIIEIPENPHFQIDLEASRVYRKANRHSSDNSFCSSAVPSHAWTGLSDVSLSDISVISVVALPITSSDISNSNYYKFHEGTLAVRELGSIILRASPWANDPPDSPTLQVRPPTLQQATSSPRSSSPVSSIAAPRDHQQGSFIPSKFMKIVVQGPLESGINELTARFASPPYAPGAAENVFNFYDKVCVIDGIEVQLTIQAVLDVLDGWPPGLYDGHLRDGDAYLLVHSLASESSFERVMGYPSQITREHDRPSYPMALVGHHRSNDLIRTMLTLDGELLARNKVNLVVEVSEDDPVSLREAFFGLVRERWAYERAEWETRHSRELKIQKLTVFGIPYKPFERRGTRRGKALLKRLRSDASLSVINED